MAGGVGEAMGEVVEDGVGVGFLAHGGHGPDGGMTQLLGAGVGVRGTAVPPMAQDGHGPDGGMTQLLLGAGVGVRGTAVLAMTQDGHGPDGGMTQLLLGAGVGTVVAPLAQGGHGPDGGMTQLSADANLAAEIEADKITLRQVTTSTVRKKRRNTMTPLVLSLEIMSRIPSKKKSTKGVSGL